jgi:outer membrane receptor protein involved in Fe transport
MMYQASAHVGAAGAPVLRSVLFAMNDRPFSLLFLLLAGTASLAAPAAAADDADTIVVTAQRQAYRGDFTLRETPQAITQIGQQQIDNNNITRLSDALDLSASVARQNNFGGLWDAYAVRGFAGDENLPSGYLVNGFNGGRGFGGSARCRRHRAHRGAERPKCGAVRARRAGRHDQHRHQARRFRYAGPGQSARWQF